MKDPDVFSVVQDAIYDARNQGKTIGYAAQDVCDTLGPHIYSDVIDESVIGGRRVTWRELYEELTELK